jgi:UDP-N-acetylmuramoylalanine-D-glutamate ligase
MMVDSHDVMLVAPPGSPDHEALEQLKTANAEIVADVSKAWDAAGLMTERNYLREKIRQVRDGSNQ